MPSKFVHLHTHSHYSLLDGMSKIPDLVNRAKELGMTSLAVTDHGNLYGAVEFYRAATKAGIKPIMGVEAYIAPGDHKEKSAGAGEDKYYHLLLLVQNETGWKNLLQLVTKSWLDGFYYRPRMDKEMIRKHHEGLIATSACLGGELSQLILKNQLEEAEKNIHEYQDIFSKENYFIEIGRHPKIEDIEKVNPHLIALSKKTGAPLVATSDSHYLHSEDKDVHDILLAIQTGKSVNDPKKFTLTDDFSFASGENMEKTFADLPEAIENTAKIAERCNFKMELGKILLPRFDTPDGSDSSKYLRELVAERTPERYPSEPEIPGGAVMNEVVAKRISYELEIIEKMGFPDYFLIVQDFINWAKDRGVVVGPGRGSAAGSIISYILKITDLDPIHYELLFERFLNPERIQMPDIDIDITDVRRGEVFGYLTEKYGADRVAHIITFGTMAARAAIRDVGRATDIELSFCDRLAKLIPFNKKLDEALGEVAELAQLYKTDERAKKIINAAKKLEGVARHASVHACGTVIAAEPLPNRVPLQHAPQDENVVLTQFEMYSIEALGLLKMDILGLKNLTIIEDTIRLVSDTHDERLDIGKIPLDDKQTFELLQHADTVGVFQLECLTGDTIVSNTTIKKLFERQTKKYLRSIYLDTGKIRNNKIKAIAQSGIKKVFRLTLADGRLIKASADHMFLTKNGWIKLKDLNIRNDQLLYNPTSKHVLLHQCVSCGTTREILSENVKKHNGFCHTCSAKHFRNPSKKKSRVAISTARRAFYVAGGQPWNQSLTKETSSVIAETGRKISRALTGVTLEMRYGPEQASLMRHRASKKFSGVNNPMFGKKSPHRKGGIREDLGHYVRSNWEADFARILNLHKVTYQYEPHTFTLTRKNGNKLSYTPDFFTPATNTYYEIKGWMHDLDAEKIKLFEEQYPQYNFVLIDKTKFAEFALQYKNLVKWECPRIPNKLEFSKIKSIEELEEEMTYDIVMESPGNNFVANSLIVHNSGGMRRYLKELKPSNLEDIIAMVALYRPGPMELIPSYIARKHGKEIVTHLHPKMEPILGNTFGIGIYQEQMMRIASDMAGYSLAEADTLRKAIGKKIKKLLDEQEVKLTQGLIKNGIPERTARQIWDLFPPFARYGFNRCLTGDTRIQNPKTGELITIKELFENRSRMQKALSLNEECLKTYKNTITDVVDNGIKPVFELKTRSGRKVIATANHPFYTTSGWQNLDMLNAGDRLATPSTLPEPERPIAVESHRLALLGYLLSKGNLCHPHGFYYYAKDPIEVADYCKTLSAFNNTQPTIDRSKTATAVYSRRTNLHEASEAVEWVNSLGMKYKKATEKTFPTFVFQLSNQDISILIAKMFQGDGCINGKRKDAQIFYATSSWTIARDMQHLLLRLNVLSTIHTKKFKYRGGVKIGYTVSVNRYDNIKKFLVATIPHLVGRKQLTAQKILLDHPIISGEIKESSARGSKDIIPTALALQPLRTAVMASVGGFRQADRIYGIPERLFHHDAKKIGYLRETINALGNLFADPILEKLSTSDIYWDEVVSITPAGTMQTYDLTMQKDHNFIANDIFVHNSHAACYAMIAYRTAYLKARYPTEFMTALLNSEKNDVERIGFLINESKKMKVQVLPPDINKSSQQFAPEGNNIRFGLAAIKNVGANIVGAIIDARSQGGPFSNLTDLLTRVQHKDLNKKSLESLTKCGALDNFDIERNTILQNLDEITKFAQTARKSNSEDQGAGLFGNSFVSTVAPKALQLNPAEPATKKEKLVWEKELLGLYVSDHPLSLANANGALTLLKPTKIKDVLTEKSTVKNYRICGMIISVKAIITKTGKPMCFTKVEDQSGSIEVVVFSDTYAKNQACFKDGAVVVLTGRLNFRNGEVSLVCDQIKEIS